MIGTSVGNYVVQKKIGEGGMGAVYVAEHKRLGRRVAVKVLLPHMSRNPELIARFFNEAKAATEIKNEHIVDVLDFGELEDGSSYIVMEWLEGQSLSDLLTREGRLPVARTAHIAHGLAKALAAAHAHGIVHRDLKPDNIFLVTRDGDPDFVKVLDFGIAKLMLSDAGDVRTQTGAIMGTPYYMSPEQCNGAAIDQRTDVYAMGVILYQMLTGTVPFNMPRLTELLVAHVTQKPPPLRTLEPSVPPAVESAVLQALEKDPAHRFNSTEALARALLQEAVTAQRAAEPTPLAVTPQVAAPTAPMGTPSLAKTAGEMFVRIGVRGKRPFVLLGVAGAFILLVLFLVMRHPSSTSPNAVIAGGTKAEIPADEKSVTRWKLKSTNCGGGKIPELVETTQTGSTIVSSAEGFPDSTGTAKPDGSFTVKNHSGWCKGKRTGSEVVERCGGNDPGSQIANGIGKMFGQGAAASCKATYLLAD